MKKALSLFILFLAGCLSPELMKLASEYQASVTFFDHAQKNLREIYSLCDYKEDCFKERATEQINQVLCPKYQEYNFVSEKECQRAGQGVIDLVLGKTELAVPIRNTAQDAHNDRMYELEKQRVKQNRQMESQRQAEQRRQEQQRQQRINSLLSVCSIKFSDCVNKCFNHHYYSMGREYARQHYEGKICSRGVPCRQQFINTCSNDQRKDFECNKEKTICEARARATQ